MPDLTAIETARGDLSEHPAMQAWSDLLPSQVQPVEIQKLKRNKKSAIYRLTGAGPGGSAIIAKRCLAGTGMIERRIYEQILPRLAVPALRFFGFVEDRDAQFCWLFIEDAGAELYLPELAAHRAAAARWLGLLHTSAVGLEAAARLPGRGPAFYQEHLRLARGNIVKAFANPALKAEEQGVLEAIVAQCDFLDSRWNQVNALCQGMPPTFVHGDLKAKNIRVRHTSHGIAVLPFDWEIAGWGVPAVDLLKCPDLAIYWAEAQGHWPDLKLRELERLAEVGELFRALIAIYWKSLALIYEWVEWPVEKLRLYRAKLAECIQSLGLE